MIMRKLKILQFPIANSKGGITHYALENWKWIDKERFQCDFATMSRHLDFEDEILSTGSKIYYLSCYAEDDRKQFVKEFNEILNHNYDVVHIHTKQWKSCLVENLCKKHNVSKVIVHSHSAGINTLDDEKHKYEIYEHERIKKIFDEKMATDFWACSRLAADFLFGEQISRNKIKIMPNAIELDKFSFNEKKRNMYRKEYGLENCFVIGHVGRFEYQKNHEFLVDVFYEISKQIDYARLVLLGSGQLFTQIQNKIKKMGINNKVLLLGKRDDINNWYQVMDVFCLPSRFEGLPISMIEAQASGLPCLGSDYITDEVKICKNVELLPLIEKIWISRLIREIKIGREDNMTKLIQQGYDIKKQIKNIENEYMLI